VAELEVGSTTDSNSTAILVGTVVGVLCIILAIALFCYTRRHKLLLRYARKNSSADKSMSASSTGRGSGLAARRSRLAPRLIPACRVQTAEYAVPTLEERPNARPGSSARSSRLVLLRGAAPLPERPRVSAASNRAQYTTRATSGLLALQRSRANVVGGSPTRSKHKGLPRQPDCSELIHGDNCVGTGTSRELETQLSGSSSDSHSPPEFAKKTKGSLEDEAAEQLRLQALSFVNRARRRARDARAKADLARCSTAGPTGGACAKAATRDEGELEQRRPSFLACQRRLMQQLKQADIKIDVANLMADDEETDNATNRPPSSPQSSAHDWLSRALASPTQDDIGELVRSDPQQALSRARRAKSACGLLGVETASPANAAEKLKRARSSHASARAVSGLPPTVLEVSNEFDPAFFRTGSSITAPSPPARQGSSPVEKLRQAAADFRSSHLPSQYLQLDGASATENALRDASGGAATSALTGMEGSMREPHAAREVSFQLQLSPGATSATDGAEGRQAEAGGGLRPPRPSESASSFALESPRIKKLVRI